MATAIIVDQIPGAHLDPDAVDAAATDLKTQSGLVRDAGSDVKTTWGGLTYAYTAPESATLLAVMNPVATDADSFADQLDRVAGALTTFAADIRVIKAGFDSVRADARAFHWTISGDDEWNQNQDHVDTNDNLRRRVADEQVRLWEAERTCANTIRAIDNIAQWHAMTGEDDGFSYGYAEISEDAETAWGNPVDREDECPKSAAVGVKRFVWDGIVVDILWEGLVGIGGMVGIGEDGWSWETLSDTWSGMGALIGLDPTTKEWGWGTAGDAWLTTGKSLIAYDMWSEDPARAAGTVAGNIALAIFTVGIGTAAKGVSTAGKTGAVLAKTSRAATVLNKFIDPVDLAFAGAKALKGFKFDEFLTGLQNVSGHLGNPFKTSLHAIDVDVHVEVPRTSANSPGIHETNPAGSAGKYDGPDTGANPSSDLNNTQNHNQHTSTNPETVPVREPELVHVGGHESSNGSGGDGGGAGGSNFDDSAPGTGGEPGGEPGGGRPEDLSPVPEKPSMDQQVAGQPVYSQALEQQLTRHGMTEPEFKELVNTPLDQMSKGELETLIKIREALPQVDEHTILQKIITPDTVTRLFGDIEANLDLSTPEGVAAKAAVDELRQNHPEIFSSQPSSYAVDSVGGFVSRTADVNHLDTAEMYRSLGLDYPGSPFSSNGQARVDQTLFGIEFEAGMLSPTQGDHTINTVNAHFDELQGLSGKDYEARVQDFVEQDFRAENLGPLTRAQAHELAERVKYSGYAFEPGSLNPHRGNGFGGSPNSGNYTPELQFFDRPAIPEGAELWKIAPDGQRVPVARFDGDDWILLP